MKQRNSSFWLAGGISLFCLGTSRPVQAQVSSDGTLSTNVKTTDNRNFTITNGNRAGSNLFHSFSQFSVPTGGSAVFDNAPDIHNIISRVTGSSISNIDGLIRANPSANLFLLNPNGIIFGPNASLNVGGSILASTASSLKFADGTQFSATAPQTIPLLTISVPLGLQFGANPGSILVQGYGLGLRKSDELIDTTVGLHVQPNQTLAMVGGDVTLEGGTLKTAGGRIELGSVAGPSSVSLTPTYKGWFLGYEGIQNFRHIHLSQKAAVDASGAGGGDIQVRGRRVTLTDGSQIEASTLMSEPGGTLAVNALELVELIGTSADGQLSSSLGVQVYPGATGAGGNLTIETRRLNVRNGAQIATGTFGAGNAGALIVRASDSVELSGEGKLSSSGLFAQSNPEATTGAGGNLTIETGRLNVRDGAQIATSTFSAGNAGALIVRASDSVELSGEGKLISSGLFAQSNKEATTGAGGNLTIETRRLNVRDGAQISTSTFSAGNAGALIVRASDSVELSGEGKLISSGLFAQSNPEATTGAGGNLSIETRRLNVRDGAQITTSTFSPANAGALIVRAFDSVELSGEGKLGYSGLFSRPNPGATGTGGDLTIATGKLIVRDGAQVDVNSVGVGSGAAGNLEVAARSVLLDNQGKLRSETDSGQGGNINLHDLDLLLMRHNSQISTTAGNAQAGGNGGKIYINSKLLVAIPQEDSDIRANAYTGKGGTVQIAAERVFGIQPRNQDTPQSDITASSQLGINGTVQINTLVNDPSLGLVNLPVEPVDVSGLIAQGCPSDVKPRASKFIVTGRGGLPDNPSDLLSSDAVQVDLVSLNPESENRSVTSVSTQPTSVTPAPLVEATGWVIGANGQVTLTAQAPTATLQIPWLNPAICHLQ